MFLPCLSMPKATTTVWSATFSPSRINTQISSSDRSLDMSSPKANLVRAMNRRDTADLDASLASVSPTGSKTHLVLSGGKAGNHSVKSLGQKIVPVKSAPGQQMNFLPGH